MEKSILFIEFLKITAANHLMMLLKALENIQECKVVLICQKGSLLSRKFEFTKVIVYEIDFVEFNTHNIRTYYPYLHQIFLISRIIKRHKINIIHSHRLNWAYITIPHSIILDIPMFIHVVIIEKLSSKFQTFLLSLHKKITYVCVSIDSTNKFKKFYKEIISHQTKITYYYSGLFFPLMNSAASKKISYFEKRKKNKIIAMVSRMDPLKGVDVFIEAAAIISQRFPEIEFVHVGYHKEYNFKTGYYELCKRRIRNLNLESKFKFLPYTDNILSYYKYFYLLALPTYKDTLSFTNLEANFNKVPVIFTDVDGLMETSKPELNCSVPFPPSPLIIANKISNLIDDITLRDKTGNEVSSHIKRKFNSSKNITKLIQFYEEFS